MENELKEKFPEALKDNRLFGSICRQKEQIWRLVRIIDNICEHSQFVENSVQLQLEQHDLVSIISGLVNRFLTLANVNHNIAFTFQSKVDSLPGKWDKLRIEHAILNLMSNALRFGKRTPIEVSIEHVDNFAHIFVRDNGPGISQDDQKNIFGRVGSGLTEMSGMGLGLHITEQIIRSHGGKVLVHSELGNGTVFTVVLPCIR
jgi:signal transduction histidine kinase